MARLAKSVSGDASVKSSDSEYELKEDIEEEHNDFVSPLLNPLLPRPSKGSSEKSLEAAEQDASASKNPLFFNRRSSLTLPPGAMARIDSGDKSSNQDLMRQLTSDVHFKIVVNTPTIPNTVMDEQLLSIGYSFGRTCQNDEK